MLLLPYFFCVENVATISLPLGFKRLTENMMEINSLQEALKDFDKKGTQEVAPLLDQFLCHVAKTGETMVQWSQFKSYFLFKLEKVMDDFIASAPDQRGVANPNVESIPFEDMKERILKIVNGYNGIPFTIQRLCELLTEPKRNYTGTEKFLRGVEKNVMVVSCVHPTSEKNGCSGVNRINGVMLPGNSSAFTERKVNGPGTPRPLNRPKLSLVSSLATNGLPDSTENKDPTTEQGHDTHSSEVSASDTLGSSVKNKHYDDQEVMEAEQHEVKRLKFNKDKEEEQKVDTLSSCHADSLSEETESMVQEKEEEDSEAASTAGTCEDQEPSSTQSEPSAGPGADTQGALLQQLVPDGPLGDVACAIAADLHLPLLLGLQHVSGGHRVTAADQTDQAHLALGILHGRLLLDQLHVALVVLGMGRDVGVFVQGAGLGQLVSRLSQLTLLLLRLQVTLRLLRGGGPDSAGAIGLLDRRQQGLEDPVVELCAAVGPGLALVLFPPSEGVVWGQLQGEGGAAAALSSVVGAGAVLVRLLGQFVNVRELVAARIDAGVVVAEAAVVQHPRLAVLLP
uniref:Protein phosphatase 4, regulatory subunit 2b n=1 Tax=Oncorhynchus mykiss TaxID=8022 RepID=A0A8C7S239_ONCMY